MKTKVINTRRVAIETKYLGPTNTLGSRVKAKCSGGQVIIDWDCALNGSDNHAEAAKALIKKMQWTDVRLVQGGMGSGYVFVMVD